MQITLVPTTQVVREHSTVGKIYPEEEALSVPLLCLTAAFIV
jgi:hypothetical protein